ncbi:hypothetical protein D3C78_1660320 [compost metagenome]
MLGVVTPGSQLAAQGRVVEFFLTSSVARLLQGQGAVPDHPSAARELTQLAQLLAAWLESEFVGLEPLHAFNWLDIQYSLYSRNQSSAIPPRPEERGFPRIG